MDQVPFVLAAVKRFVVQPTRFTRNKMVGIAHPGRCAYAGAIVQSRVAAAHPSIIVIDEICNVTVFSGAVTTIFPLTTRSGSTD